MENKASEYTGLFLPTNLESLLMEETPVVELAQKHGGYPAIP
jgi:hypothetical protein